MARIIGLLIAVLGAAAVIIWLTTIEGYTRVEFDGYYIDPPTGLLLGALFALALALIFGTSIIGALGRLPARLRASRESRQREKGMTALTRGLEAVAAGDAEDAQHHARLANKNLDQPALTRLLTAQAAQLAGDDDTARESYAAMLEAPETEFLGLRGLYLQAMHRGDKTEAKAYADRAFRLRPGAPWAFESVYALSVERGQWGDAHEALRLAQKQGVQQSDEAARKSAALLTARAYAARDAEDNAAAREDAEDAVAADPGLAPAAALAAKLQADAGKRSRAAKTLGAAWERAPHPALAKTMREVFADAPQNRRAARLRKLAERNPDHPESQILLAELALEDGEPAAARALLEPLLLDAPNARTFAVMADAMEALHGKAAAEPWLEKAAAAPRDTVPGASGSFELTTEGWQRLVREYGDHGRLAPPPLEIVETGLAREELLALMAPAPAMETADDQAGVTALGANDQAGEDGGARSADSADEVGDDAAQKETVSPSTQTADDADEDPVAVHAARGEIVTGPADALAAPKRKRRFGAPFRSADADAEARIDEAVGPAMRDEALAPVSDDPDAR